MSLQPPTQTAATSAGADEPQPLEPLAGRRTNLDGSRFPWGPIDHIHQVGEYHIVEYREDLSTFRTPRNPAHHGRTLYTPAVNRKSVGTSHLTLDSALIAAIAFKREGPNSRAAEYFDRMTGVNDQD